MEYTQNYQLPLWDKEDAVLRTDFNENNQKIDAALGAAGNCKITAGSYVGTGTYGSENPNNIPYDKKPLFIMMNVGQYNSYNDLPKVFIFFCDVPKATSNGSNTPLTLTWNDTGVSWYFSGNNSDGYAASRQFNISGQTYHYLIFSA